MTNTLRYYRRVPKPVLRSKSFFGIKYSSKIEYEDDLVPVVIEMGDEIGVIKSMFQQPVGSKTRRALAKLLGEDSYGFILDINGIPFVPE